MEIDTLIIGLSETKIFNRSHNNRCVQCHGRDLQCAVGHRQDRGQKGIMIPTQDVVRCVTLMLDDEEAFLVMKFKYKFTHNS